MTTTDTPPTPAEWQPEPDEPDVISTWCHSGMRADISGALDQIDIAVFETPDLLERDCFRRDEFSVCQRLAFELVRDHVRTIVALADFLIRSGGSLDAKQVESFFAGKTAWNVTS